MFFFVAADGDVQICASIANKYDLCPSKYEHILIDLFKRSIPSSSQELAESPR